MTAVGSGRGHLRNGGRKTKRRSAEGARDRILCFLGLGEGGFACDTHFVWNLAELMEKVFRNHAPDFQSVAFSLDQLKRKDHNTLNRT